jgi:hypothetical protein
LKKYLDYLREQIHPATLLLIVAILAYGLLIPRLGFYWDDLPMSWIRYQLGFEDMTKYFSTNRPVWALLYQVTTRILPQVPIYWQILALLMRWLGAVTVWGIGAKLFPHRKNFALTLALVFLLYPGFNQQWGSYLYSHFFIVLLFFLLSYYLMLHGKTIAALTFSALNLWMMEYFFTLELIRPLVIWISLAEESLTTKERLLRTLKLWTPYLGVFILAVLSRLFIFNNTIYQFNLKEEFIKAPLDTMVLLISNVFSSLWNVTAAAWALAFQLPNSIVDGPLTIGIYVLILAIVGALTLFGLWRQAAVKEGGASSAKWIVALGVVMLIFAGPPFWLTDVPVSLGYPANRATLAFLMGSSFVLAGLLEFLPSRFKVALIVIFISLAAGRQFLWANEFRRDWDAHKNMFWQMTWRAPGLQKNTIVLINEELSYYADNSLSAALNWIYGPDEHDSAIDYVLFYPTNRESLSLQKDIPVTYPFLAGDFTGSTSQAVVFYYAPPKCLRLLDPEIDSINRLIPDESLMREAALLSSTTPILSEQTSSMPGVYGPEPAHGWCYFFAKAELARQMGDWETVTHLGDDAFELDDYPNDPVERFVYIEGYAHAGDWEKAVEYSIASYKVSKNYVGPLLCTLWDRIERETAASAEQRSALTDVRNRFECLP